MKADLTFNLDGGQIDLPFTVFNHGLTLAELGAVLCICGIAQGIVPESATKEAKAFEAAGKILREKGILSHVLEGHNLTLTLDFEPKEKP